jgi:hypothetical protein
MKVGAFEYFVDRRLVPTPERPKPPHKYLRRTEDETFWTDQSEWKITCASCRTPAHCAWADRSGSYPIA